MAKKKAVLPKRIAGVKIPKKVRKGQLGAMLRTPLGQEVLAGLVVAATGALTAAQAKPNSPGQRVAARVKHATGDTGAAAAAGGSALTYAIGEAARSFADALHRGEPHDGEPRDGEARWTSEVTRPTEIGGKKSQLGAGSGP